MKVIAQVPAKFYEDTKLTPDQWKDMLATLLMGGINNPEDGSTIYLGSVEVDTINEPVVPAALLTPQQVRELAEEAIVRHTTNSGVQNPEDTRKALEMLISSAGRAIEKYLDSDTARSVLLRTAYHIAEHPAKREEE